MEHSPSPPLIAATTRRRRAVRAAASITVRLVVFAVVLASVTAAAVGVLSYTRARRALEHAAQARLALLARDVAADFERDLQDRLADVSSWTQLDVMRAVRFRDVDKELAEFLRRLLSGRDTFRAIACFDGGGTLVASAGALEGYQWTMGPARPRVTTGPPAARGRSVQFEAPIIDPDHPGSMIGTLVAIVEPLRLWQTADAMTRTQSPQTGLLVRTADGHVLVDTVADSATAPGPVARLVGTATLNGLPHADSPGFELTVSEPATVALAAIEALRTALLRTSSVAIAIASILGALVALWIGRPIRRLTIAVQRVSASGELDMPNDLPAGGEVGVLAAAFRRMMATVAEAQADLVGQSRLAVLGEIAANVAHEVRTPLAVLKTSAQLLGRPGLPAEEQRQLSGMLTAEVDRLNRVVTDLVDLGRPRVAHYEMESMRDAVDRAVRFFAPTAERRGVVIVANTGTDALLVTGSRDQLHQVLVNLLHNALQAMPAGGRITVTTGRDGGSVVVSVEDTGPGFPAAVLEAIFTRFFTTKVGGSGLGLAISKRLIEEHRGRIEASNVATGGARVTLWLPHATEEQ